MANICLKIRAIKTKTEQNQAHTHNNPEQAEKLIDQFKESKKRFSQNVTKQIRTLRENGELDRKFSKNEIELAEIVFTGSPDWFRDKSKLPQGWRDLSDEEKSKLWEKHPADPKNIERFKRTALKMLRDNFPEVALLNVTLHTHETTPHIHALLLPMTKPEPSKKARLSYDKIFGQAKGRKEKNGFEEWQDKAGQYFEPIGLERGQRGSASIYKAPKEWNEETQQAKDTAKEQALQIKQLMKNKALLERYGERDTSVFNSKEDNARIKQAQKLKAQGLTAEKIGQQIANRYYKAVVRAETERNAKHHLQQEKKKASETIARFKIDSDFSKMFEKAKKKDPKKAEQALETLKSLSTPAERPKLVSSAGPDLKALSRPAPQISTSFEPQPKQEQTNAQESPQTSSNDGIGEAEPQPDKPFDKMTPAEQIAFLKKHAEWEKRENERREREQRQKRLKM